VQFTPIVVQNLVSRFFYGLLSLAQNELKKMFRSHSTLTFSKLKFPIMFPMELQCQRTCDWPNDLQMLLNKFQDLNLGFLFIKFLMKWSMKGWEA